MFQSFLAWRKLMRLLRQPKAWKMEGAYLVHGSHVRVYSFFGLSPSRVILAVDGVDVPLSFWRRWRLRRTVMKLLLRKLATSL